jgi:hypothetical protein
MHRPEARTTVDLSGYPDPVVIYLGMRVHGLRGIRTLLGFGPQIRRSWQAMPDGPSFTKTLSGHWSSRMPACASTGGTSSLSSAGPAPDPHQRWWKTFLRDPGATGFWHEAYSASGRIEGIYDDIRSPIGMSRFAPSVPARGTLLLPTRAVTATPRRSLSAACRRGGSICVLRERSLS